MKLNTILIIAGIVVLVVIQLYLFRMERVNDYYFRNRYTDHVYSLGDLMNKSQEEPESKRIQNMKSELEKSKLIIDSNNRDIRKFKDQIFRLQTELAKNENNKKAEKNLIFEKASRLCYLMKCAGVPQYAMNSIIEVDGKGSTWYETIHVIMKQRNELEQLLLENNKKAPE
jgi:hypothetical protein